MLGRKSLLAVGAVVAGLLLPAPAMAQFEAITDADLNLRVGPGVIYGVIDVIPYGDVVDVFGCLEEVAWCDVEWWGLRGWVSARYLVHLDTAVYLPQVYARIGVPIISFSFSTYHDRYYRDRPWYKKRDGRWRGRDWRRGDRPKRERREKRRDAERPQQVEPSRQQRQIERARQQRQQELQEAERPRRQQREVEPSRQQRQIERARQERQQQLQEAEQPRRGQRSERQGQRSERQGQRSESQGQRSERQGQRPQSQGRSDSSGQAQELLEDRGQ